mmetsp:Transcript_9375/g.24249  ORF Transcript_9375/g.24249 Transcript_9375/m.24249 type:complete len:225 (-) Transcript_9375:150-824(-)
MSASTGTRPLHPLAMRGRPRTRNCHGHCQPQRHCQRCRAALQRSGACCQNRTARRRHDARRLSQATCHRAHRRHRHLRHAHNARSRRGHAWRARACVRLRSPGAAPAGEACQARDPHAPHATGRARAHRPAHRRRGRPSLTCVQASCTRVACAAARAARCTRRRACRAVPPRRARPTRDSARSRGERDVTRSRVVRPPQPRAKGRRSRRSRRHRAAHRQPGPTR